MVENNRECCRFRRHNPNKGSIFAPIFAGSNHHPTQYPQAPSPFTPITKYAIKSGWKAQDGYIRSYSHSLKVRALTTNFTAASRWRTPAKNRFFLRCWPKVVGSLAIGKLRIQIGATSLRATLTLRSQKGNIAHSSRKNAQRKQEFTARNTKTSKEIRARVIAARQRQQKRFAQKPKITCNARLGPKELKEFCALDDVTKELLKNAMAELNFSARAYDRIVKVARTIADLAGSENILSEHISEAIQYRSLDRQLWT